MHKKHSIVLKEEVINCDSSHNSTNADLLMSQAVDLIYSLEDE
jgi:hypothetical protein